MKSAKQEARFQKGKRLEGANVPLPCKRRVKKKMRQEGKKEIQALQAYSSLGRDERSRC